MDEIIGGILFISFFLLLYFIPKIHNLWKINKLHKHISWCYAEYSKKHRHSDLAEHLFRIQDDVVAPDKDEVKLLYRDEGDVDIILASFLEVISQSFFKSNLKMNKRIAKLSDFEYFMISLCSFLSQHYGAESICNKTLSVYSQERSQSRYAKIYILTDFGIAFQKMHYIALAYCQNNDRTSMYFRSNELDYVYRSIHCKEIELMPPIDNIFSL